MEVVTFYNVVAFLSDKKNFSNSYIQGSANRFCLQQTICIQLSNGAVIVVPEGFEWDLSSAPKLVWSMFPPFGDFLFAALIHDYLYVAPLFVLI
jgi:hypothetical protein